MKKRIKLSIFLIVFLLALSGCAEKKKKPDILRYKDKEGNVIATEEKNHVSVTKNHHKLNIPFGDKDIYIKNVLPERKDEGGKVQYTIDVVFNLPEFHYEDRSHFKDDFKKNIKLDLMIRSIEPEPKEYAAELRGATLEGKTMIASYKVKGVPENTKNVWLSIMLRLLGEYKTDVEDYTYYYDTISFAYKEPPTPTPTPTPTPVPELITKENSSEFDQLFRDANFSELYRRLDEYINTFHPDQASPTVALRDQIKIIVDGWGNVNDTYDQFEKTHILKYKGLDNISGKIHCVPSYDTNNNRVLLTFGFIKDDWLFFNDVSFVDYVNLSEIGDKVEDTVGGGNIKEAQTYVVGYIDSLNYIANLQNPAIRFSDNDHHDNNLDVTLSEKEVEAIKYMAHFGIAREIFQEIAYK